LLNRIAIHSRAFEDNKLPFIKQIFSEIEKRGIPVLISEVFHEHLTKINFIPKIEDIYHQPSDLKGTDIMLSVGGDGTFLEAVTFVQETQIPILGINTGRLGFLATTPRDRIKYGIDALFEGAYSIDERTLIQLETDRPELFGGVNIALNEFAILKRDTSSMIVVHTYIDGEYLNSYWADGLLIATPTGSTGYSLSVGGPVVVPQSHNFIIAPVSPHNLNVRPLIVPDESIIAFEIEGRSKNFLVSLDSRSEKVDASIQMAIRRCNYPARLVRLNGENFLKTLRLKLNWGVDVRNHQYRYR
jgi:NAD+ kinase